MCILLDAFVVLCMWVKIFGRSIDGRTPRQLDRFNRGLSSVILDEKAKGSKDKL